MPVTTVVRVRATKVERRSKGVNYLLNLLDAPLLDVDASADGGNGHLFTRWFCTTVIVAVQDEHCRCRRFTCQLG